MYSTAATILFAAAASLPVLAATPDALALATVKQQFINAKIVPDAVSSFSPTALLNLTFPSAGNVPNGRNLTKEQSGDAPKVVVTGNSNSTKYTIMMVDADYVGSQDNNNLNVHWLENGATIGSDGVVTGGNGPIKYAGPAPPAGSGPHRYTILLFDQPDSFTAPSTPQNGTSVQKVQIGNYLSQAKLTNLLAGTYFTVENGVATVSVDSTQAVNPATLSVSSTPTGSGGSSPSGSASGSPTSKPSNSASKASTGVAGAFLGLLAAAVVAF